MTQPSYTTDLTDMDLAEAATNFTELASPYNGGGTPALDGENFIQGTDCVSQSTGTKSGLVFSIVYNAGSDQASNFTSGTDVVLMWFFYAVGPNLDTYANSGWRAAIGSSTSAIDTFDVGGSDFARNPYGGWYNVAVDPYQTEDAQLGGGNAGAFQYFGSMPDTLASISKGTPHAVDAIRRGRAELIIEYGDATNGYCTFQRMSNANDANDNSFTADTTNTDATLTNISPNTDSFYEGMPISGTGIPGSTEILSITNSTTAEMTNNATATNTGTSITAQPYNRWGLFQTQFGSFLWKGLMSLGNATNAVDFRDSNALIIVDETEKVFADFNKIEINNASSRVDWTSVTFQSLSTAAPGDFEATANADINFDLCTFVDMGTFDFGGTNTTCTNSVFQGCDIVTGTSGDFTGSKVLESTAAVDAGAFVWDVATDPDTFLDGMAFSKGTNAHHAIDFGTNVTGNITLRNCDFSGFGSTDDSNDSTVRFLATSGSLTLSLVGCKVDGVAATTSNFSVDDAVGTLTVTLSIDPVALDIHVDDNEGNNLVGARVYVAASSGAGDLPYNDSVTGITRSGTVATVDMTAHGMNVGEYVNLDGITGDKTADNWGAHEILTSADVDTFTYATADSGDTTYSGTITATGVLIDDVTDASGDISASRTLAASQPIEGVVRKSSSGATRFKSFTLGGTVDNANGLTINVRMILDE